MRRPLRSKRATTSPVRARWKASGFTRIRVRLTGGAPLGSFWRCNLLLGLACPLAGSALGVLHPARRGFPLRTRTLAAALPLGKRTLAVRAQRPARVDRLATARAGVLEALLALRAAQVVLLHWVFAFGAGGLGQLAHTQLRGTDLELPFMGVLEELGRPHDRVDGGADVGEEGADRRAGDQERIGDTAARVEIGVDDQREPDDDDRQQEEGDGQVETAVADAEDR